MERGQNTKNNLCRAKRIPYKYCIYFLCVCKVEVVQKQTKWGLHRRTFELSVLGIGDVTWSEYMGCLNGGLKMEEFFVENQQTTKLF